MIARRVRVVLCAGLFAAASACSNPRQAAPAPGASTATRDAASEALEPVVLPDLSSVAESVQQQLRARHAALVALLADPATPKSELARQHGELGHLLVAATFFDEAALCYRHAEASEPDAMRWAYYLGHAYLKEGDRAGAATAFERALALEPEYVPALIWLGDMYLDTGRIDQAQASFVRAVALQPQSAAAHFGAGRAALARGAHAEAVAHFEDALKNDAQATAIHYPLAMAYRATGDRSRAEALLRQRGSRVPRLDDPLLDAASVVLNSPVSFEGLGMQALRAQDWAAAVDAFRRGLELAPADPSLRYWLATALFASGDAAGAEREFNAVVRTNPDFARAHFSLGVIHERRGQQADALRAFTAAVRYAPNLPEARLRLAETSRAVGRIADSVGQYEAAVALDPGLADAWVGGAQALVALGRTDQARDWIARGRRLHPARPELAALEQQLH